jgi:glycosyltransferase involved in cell wall biosynthesis/SAM-dependent methyltransferase
MTDVFGLQIPAKCRILWAQDLLVVDGTLGPLHQVDRVMFVSEYQKKQWIGRQPMVAPLAAITKNPIDLRDRHIVRDCDDGTSVKDSVLNLKKVPGRFIHISRPERGVDGLIALWPKIRERLPHATLRVCRYNSMYDSTGWGEICRKYDAKLEATNERYGGIEFIGELNKPQLYSEIAQAVAMVYPTTQPNFAETNCIACSEAQACGTPFIGSWRGALPETLAPGAGILIDGDVLTDAETQDSFVEACAFADAGASHGLYEQELETFADTGRPVGAYAQMRVAGLARAEYVDGPIVAAEWDVFLRDFFETRYHTHKIGVLRTLLQWDNHAPAVFVAHDVQTHHGVSNADYNEAVAAEALCGRVIRQEEQTAVDYATYAVQDPAIEITHNSRLLVAADAILKHLGDKPNPLVLDVACGNGSMALLLLQKHPTLRVLGVDYSDGVLNIARKAMRAAGFETRTTFVAMNLAADLTCLAETQADAVFCGEYLEHVEQPWALLDGLELACAPDGRIVLTTPCGPFAELLDVGVPRLRGHVHAFSLRDIAHMCRPKESFSWRHLPIGATPRGNPCGYWILSFTPGGGPAQALDYTHTILTERPYQRLVAMMIVKNEVGRLHECLASIQRVVDETIIVDTGSTDGTLELAEAMGATVVSRPWTNSFSEARNACLDLAEPKAEWLLWIDADERLDKPEYLRHFASDSGCFVGFVLRQLHLLADGENFDDKPVRLFRAGHGIRFYGRVHEQPETARDAGITPSLDQTDVKLIHLGYQTNHVRRQKLTVRNLPLLMQDIRAGNCRELDYVLYLRDLLNTAMFDMQDAGGQLTKKAYAHFMQLLKVYDEQGFNHPAHRSHKIAWPSFQQAIKVLGNGFEVKWSFLAARGELPKGATPAGEDFFVRSTAEARAIIDHRVSAWLDQMDGPIIDTAPARPHRARPTLLQTSA